MKTRKIRYSIFRYQLLPNESHQFELFAHPISKDELIVRKNEFFKDVVLNDKATYKGSGARIIGKVEYINEDDILLKIGVEKSKEINRPDFKKETIKDYPNINVYINNRKDKQFLVIENNLEAFSDTSTVINMLKNTWNRKIEQYRISLYIEQVFNANEFWDTIRMYENKGITALKFELIKPNISNISGQIKNVVSVIGNDLNGHIIDVGISAPRHGTLENIEEGNEVVESFLSYNKEGGGGPPYIRVKGLRRSIKTIKSEKTFEIDVYDGPLDGLIKILNDKIE